METYFWINLEVGTELIEFGPYLSFEDAAAILLDHIHELTTPYANYGTTFTASITECYIEKNEWIILSTKVTEEGKINAYAV